MHETLIPARTVPRTGRRDAVRLVAAQQAATLDLLRTLDAADWNRPTDCAGWTVADVVAHLVGQFEETARPWVMLRRLRAAARIHPGLPRIDGHNLRQVDELGGLSPAELLAALERFGPRASAALGRLPEPIRRTRASRLFPGAVLVEDSVGYVFDVLAPRDTWMHRVDLARATGHDLITIPGDAEVVGQVVRELGDRWTSAPVVLSLTGDAGGSWILGDGRPVGTLTADTVDCMRSLSGRVLTGSDVHGDPAAAHALAAARVEF
jgi:uncharacterized protein (TIGR03083 family)